MSLQPNQLIALAVRLFSIWLFLYMLRQFTALSLFFAEKPTATEIAAVFSFYAVLIVITVLMWKFPLSVAKRIYTFPEDAQPKTNWNHNEAYGLGFILLGILFLFQAVSSAVYWGWFLMWVNTMDAGDRYVTWEQKASMATTVVKLLFAIAMIAGSKGLTRIIIKLRYGGLS